MTDVGIAGAFLGGILALLSPCSALLLPAFFAYAFKTKRQLIARTGMFLLGMLLVLTPLGFGAGFIGQTLNTYRDTLILIGGCVIVLLGVVTLLGGGFNVPFLSRLNSKTGGSTVLLGMVYGFSGFCAGPLLGAVLATAVLGGNPLKGAATFAAYGAGMTVPLFILALCWEKFNIGQKRFLRGKWVTVVSGLLFIGIGLLFILSHGTASLPMLFSIETQEQVQLFVKNVTAPVSNTLLLLVVLAVCALGLLIYILRTGGFRRK